MCPVVFEKPRIPGCPRCWRNAIGLLHFFIPAKHERKRGHKPSEACGDPCSDLCSFILFIVVSILGLLWTAFRHDDLFPLASLFHMHAVTCPICIFICWTGTCGLGDAFDILSTFTSLMFRWLQPFTCSPTCFRWHDPTEESFEEENSQEYDHWTTPNPGQSSFTQTIYNLAGVKRSYPSLPGKNTWTSELNKYVNIYIYMN